MKQDTSQYIGKDVLIYDNENAINLNQMFFSYVYIFIHMLICDYKSFALITVSLPVRSIGIAVKLSANVEARDDQEQKGAVPRLAESAGKLKLKKKWKRKEHGIEAVAGKRRVGGGLRDSTRERGT